MANERYAVVRTDLLAGITNPAFLENGRFYAKSGEKAEIQNGSIVFVDALEDGERESHKYTDVPADAKLTQLVLIANPELTKYSKYQHEDKHAYTNVAGKCIRGYYLHGQSFSVTEEAFKDVKNAKKGAVVSVGKDEHIMTVGTSAPAGAVTIGKIAEIEVKKNDTFYCIEIAK